MSDSRPSDDPTIEFYGHLDKAYAFFNLKLFNADLPKVMFELTNKKNVTSFLKINKWGVVDGEIVHSIALNPQIIIESTPVTVYKCIVHEMARLKVHLNDNYDELRNYHNKDWAELMESIGLMPSDTGKKGGKKTGQKVSEYPIPGGLFEQACVDFLLEGNYIKFVDATIDDSEVLAFRNNLIRQCILNGESLAEHYNNFVGNDSKYIPTDDTTVTYIDVDDYIKRHESTVCESQIQGDVEGFLNVKSDMEYDKNIREHVDKIGDGRVHELSSPNISQNSISQNNKKLGNALGELLNNTLNESANILILKAQKKKRKNKVTYKCSSCLAKCWGKPELNIKCGDCNVSFTAL